MIEKPVRSVFERNNPKYLQALGLGRCMLNNFYRLLSEGRDAAMDALEDGKVIESEFSDGQRFTSEYSESNEPLIIQAMEADIVIGGGKTLRVTRSQIAGEGSQEETKLTGEAVFNTETKDAGLHLGRTFYLLGSASVEGGQLRQKTDQDISLLEELVKGYSRSTLTEVSSAGTLSEQERIADMDTPFIAGAPALQPASVYTASSLL
jgi:hypothetical protein